jgi:adenine-specific DNA-methyltransferase
VIKYIGSKRLLVPAIAAVARSLPDARIGLDLFAGTTRVAQGMKQAGLEVHANDTASYSEVLARCYIATDAREIAGEEVDRLLEHLAGLPPSPGYFTETFCVRSRFLHPKNGARVDAIRDEIDRIPLSPGLRAIALTSLLEAADRVDSTTGLQMAYLKEWAPRAHDDLTLRAPRLLPGRGEATREDAASLVRRLDEVDLAYVDPPYNQHSYFGNYHVWETLVRNDRPEVYGIACKRIDCRENRSAFNSRRGFRPALEELLAGLRARYLLLSCSSEGYLDPAEAPGLLSRFGAVGILEVDFKRYVGAQIGIHNPKGEKVGRISHLRNREYLLLAGEDRSAISAALAAAAAALDGTRAVRVVS